MWVLNDDLRKAENSRESDILFYITGMKPTDELTQMVMLDCKSQTDSERVESAVFGVKLAGLIARYADNQ